MRLALAAAFAALLGIAPLSQTAVAGPALVVDAASGAVLHNEDATRPWYPASLTKLMTAYVVFKAIEAGRVDLGTPVMVSQRAARMAPSKMGYPAGTLVTIDNALKMIIVKSANDISVALAEGVSGSVPAFVAEMNSQSRRLGMRETRWMNPNGLPDTSQVTSARDMAILARAILTEFPQYAPLFRIHAIQSGKRVMRTHNALIYRYPGADGMKTGFICASGFNVVATATKNGRKLITVVMGAPSAKQRAVIAAQLFENEFGQGGGWFGGGGGGGTIGSLPASAYREAANIRGQVCGRNRAAAAAEAEVDDGFDSWLLPGGQSSANDSPVAALLAQQNRASRSKRNVVASAGSSPYLRNEWSLQPPIPVGPYKGERRPNDGAPPAADALAVAALEPPTVPALSRSKPGAIQPAAVEATQEAQQPVAFAAPAAPVPARRIGGLKPLAQDTAAVGEPLVLPGAIGAIRPSLDGTAVPLRRNIGQISAASVLATTDVLNDPAATTDVPLPPPRPRRQKPAVVQ